MKLLVYADNHFSKYSSILRNRGEKYTYRLENQILSINWVERMAKDKDCDAILCLGDFFDSPTLDAEEISALKDISWDPNISRVFLVGNHELGINVSFFNSANIFNLISNSTVVDKPITFIDNRTRVCFLPYITENNREPLKTYLDVDGEFDKTIVFSHNDICGIQYGSHISTTGFTIDEIVENCDLFINGHIHNFGEINKNLYNLGNLSGQNFSEDGFKYKHFVMVIDTETLKFELIENPYAIKFYKLDFTKCIELDDIDNAVSKIGNNAVVHIKCLEEFAPHLKERFSSDNNKKIVSCKLTIEYDKIAKEESSTKIEKVDYLDVFIKEIHKALGTSDIIDSEIQEIIK